MESTHRFHQFGQRLWLDNISRALLDDGRLERYLTEWSVTGLTSNPTIFDEAIRGTGDYDADIRAETDATVSAEDVFVRLALDDLRRAADLFRPQHEASNGADGWVSMEVSPLLADDTAGTVAAARAIHAMAARPNLFVKIPGTPEGVPAIEEAILEGIPINVTLLFSREQYLASARAYLRGIERRIEAGLDPRVPSVASLFVSRWDKAVAGQVPPALRNRLGIAIAGQAYAAYRELLASERWQALAARGALPQRLLWASTGTKDPEASELLYVEALAAPETINTVPEKTLRALAAADVEPRPMATGGGEAEQVLAGYAAAGIDVAALAERLQAEGAASFVASWSKLMDCIAAKREALAQEASR